jgi:hypothetical protein
MIVLYMNFCPKMMNKNLTNAKNETIPLNIYTRRYRSNRPIVTSDPQSQKLAHAKLLRKMVPVLSI